MQFRSLRLYLLLGVIIVSLAQLGCQQKKVGDVEGNKTPGVANELPAKPDNVSTDAWKGYQKGIRKYWGRAPEYGELLDIRRPAAISLSPDGNRLAVSMQTSGGFNWMEIWRIDIDSRGAYPIMSFGLNGDRGILWHPSGKWIISCEDNLVPWLLDLTTGKTSSLDVMVQGYITWLGDGDTVLASLRQAGERPAVSSQVNVRTGDLKDFTPPWRGTSYDGIGEVISTKEGDFAVELSNYPGPSDAVIAIYSKLPNRMSWKEAGTIQAKRDRNSGKIIAAPLILTWLDDGRLAYMMIPPGSKPENAKDIELWTCQKDGTKQARWLVLKDVGRPSYYPVGQWITVSSNGKRIAFFRKDKLYVFNTKDLERVQN